MFVILYRLLTCVNFPAPCFYLGSCLIRPCFTTLTSDLSARVVVLRVFLGVVVDIISVFGVSKGSASSYVSREALDTAFGRAMDESRHVLIYGLFVVRTFGTARGVK